MQQHGYRTRNDIRNSVENIIYWVTDGGFVYACSSSRNIAGTNSTISSQTENMEEEGERGMEEDKKQEEQRRRKHSNDGGKEEQHPPPPSIPCDTYKARRDPEFHKHLLQAKQSCRSCCFASYEI